MGGTARGSLWLPGPAAACSPLTSQPLWLLSSLQPKETKYKTCWSSEPAVGQGLGSLSSASETTVAVTDAPLAAMPTALLRGMVLPCNPFPGRFPHHLGQPLGMSVRRGGSSGTRSRPSRPAQRSQGIAQGLARARLVFQKSGKFPSNPEAPLHFSNETFWPQRLSTRPLVLHRPRLPS